MTSLEEAVTIVSDELDTIRADYTKHAGSLNRTVFDFHYHFSQPRTFRSSLVLAKRGNITEYMLRLPAVKAAEHDDNNEDAERTYTKSEIESLTRTACEEADWPMKANIYIETDVDEHTWQPHVGTERGCSRIVPEFMEFVTQLPEAYIHHVPEPHHCFDNTK